MKKKKLSVLAAGQLSLLEISAYETPAATSYDPYWDEITQNDDDRWNPADFGEVSRKVDGDQLTIFWDDTHEPPDPDDYKTLAEYEQAWQEWQLVHSSPTPPHSPIPNPQSPVPSPQS